MTGCTIPSYSSLPWYSRVVVIFQKNSSDIVSNEFQNAHLTYYNTHIYTYIDIIQYVLWPSYEHHANCTFQVYVTAAHHLVCLMQNLIYFKYLKRLRVKCFIYYSRVRDTDFSVLTIRIIFCSCGLDKRLFWDFKTSPRVYSLHLFSILDLMTSANNSRHSMLFNIY